MPLFNKTFTAGKMNKDMDERIVPSGEYRDAVNIEVQTSNYSDAGTAQTLMGNTKLSSMVPEGSTCVGSIADNKNDKVYYLVAALKQVFHSIVFLSPLTWFFLSCVYLFVVVDGMDVAEPPPTLVRLMAFETFKTQTALFLSSSYSTRAREAAAAVTRGLPMPTG